MIVPRNGAAPFPLIFVIGAILIIGCAKSVPPSGGPIDREPPEVLSTMPASGGTKVDRTTSCEFLFSEPIDRENVERAVYVFPSEKRQPEVKVKGDRLIVEFKDSLAADKTYIVTLGTDITDRRSNRLAQSYSLAFSTGETIDSGIVSGQIFDNGSGAEAISVALFAESAEFASTVIDSIAPIYITQSGENGIYRFTFLAPGNYKLIAFEDRNKDRRVNPDRERIGLPFSLPELSPDRRRSPGHDIRLFLRDTAAISIRSVSLTPDNVMKLRLSKTLDEASANQLPAAVSLLTASDSTTTGKVNAISALSPYPASDFLLAVEGLLPEQEYLLRLDLTHFPLFSLTDSTLFYRFTFRDVPDLTRPIIISREPDNNAQNVSPSISFAFRFSEPVVTADTLSPIWLSQIDGDTVSVPILEKKPFLISAAPEEALLHGTTYRLLIDGQAILDRAGNPLADSMLSSLFTVIGEDTLGVLSGNVTRGPYGAEAPAVITVTEKQSGRTKDMTVASGESAFRTDLLPGLYTVAAFLDQNRNGSYDHGSIQPFRLAEPFVVGVDTFRVRTRFESTGVEIKFR